MRRQLLAIGLLVGFGVPCPAAIHYRAVTTSEGEGGGAMESTVEAWVDGESAKMVFEESGNPMTPGGTYLLTTDGGRTLYLVNPEERTYSEFDIDAMVRSIGGLMQSMGGMFKFEIVDPQVDTLSTAPGGMVAGRATTLYRSRTSYEMRMKIMGMKRATQVVTEQEMWTTDELTDIALGVWLRKKPLQTGDEGLDSLIEAELQRVEGFPLRSVQVTTSTGKKGKQSVTRTTMEVTELEEVSVSADLFEIDPTYTETAMPIFETEESSPFGRRDG